MDYIKLVEELNDELYDKHDDPEECFYYIMAGFVDEIGFGDLTLWHSEDDTRKFSEKKNEYEPLKPHIKKLLRAYGNKFIMYAKN